MDPVSSRRERFPFFEAEKLDFTYMKVVKFGVGLLNTSYRIRIERLLFKLFLSKEFICAQRDPTIPSVPLIGLLHCSLVRTSYWTFFFLVIRLRVTIRVLMYEEWSRLTCYIIPSVVYMYGFFNAITNGHRRRLFQLCLEKTTAVFDCVVKKKLLTDSYTSLSNSTSLIWWKSQAGRLSKNELLNNSS